MRETNKLSIFVNNDLGVKVRTIVIANEVYFVGKDVAESLGFRDGYTATRCLDEDEKLIHTLCVGGQNREVTLINESGLYSLIMSSNKPEAKKFKKWVTSEVLPDIRKTGGYIPSSEEDTDDDILARALVIAQNKIEAKNKAIEELTPKAEAYDSLMDSKECIDIKQLASILNIKDITKSGRKVLGRNKLFEKLRKEGILTRSNQPYQRFIDAGYFRVIVTQMGFTKTLVTPKGIDYLRKRLS